MGSQLPASEHSHQSVENMAVELGDIVPNFTAATTHGKIDFHNWCEGSWVILFSHPADYTPVCTTELGRAQALSGEFSKRGVKMIALSCDEVESHKGWIGDILEYNGLTEFSYPIIADPNREVARSMECWILWPRAMLVFLSLAELCSSLVQTED